MSHGVLGGGGGVVGLRIKRNFYHCKWCYLVILKDIGLNIQCRFKSNFLPLNAWCRVCQDLRLVCFIIVFILYKWLKGINL